MVNETLSKGVIAITVVVSLALLVIIAIFLFQNLGAITVQGSASASQSILADNGSAVTISPIDQGVISSSTTSHNSSYMNFDGVNDRVDSDDRPLSGLNNISISGWVNFEPLNQPNEFPSFFGQNSDAFIFMTNASNSVSFRVDNLTGSGTAGSTFDFNSNEWFNFIGVYNSSNVLLYINGVLNSSTDFNGTIDSSADISIGGATSNFFKGSLDEIRLYNRSLTDTEVSEIFNSGRTSNRSLTEVGLVAYYPFNAGQGNTLYDVVGGNNGE